MQTIAQLAPGEKIKHKGDLTIEGNVSARAQIELIDGSLTILGNVDNDVKIDVYISAKLRKNQSVINKGSIQSTAVTIRSPIATNLSSPETDDKKPKIPIEVRINGHVGDNVKLTSDAEIEANTIGANCTIISAHDGIRAKNIGEKTTINVRKWILVADVGNQCKLNSKKYGLHTKNIGYGTTINVCDGIMVHDVADWCTLSSEKYGITAKNIGYGTTIDVRDGISVGDIADSCT